MPIKTREIKNILGPIEVQVHKLKERDTNISLDGQDSSLAKSVFFERLNSIANKFNALSMEDICDYQEMKSKITDLVDEFCSLEHRDEPVNANNCYFDSDTIDAISQQYIANDFLQFEKLEEKAMENVITDIFDKFISALEALEKLECLPLKQRLLDCWEYVKDMSLAGEIEHFQNVKELGTSVLELLEPLQIYRKSLTSRVLAEKIELFSYQLCVVFKLLVKLVEEQHQLNAPIYNCKKYVCERFCSCLKMIINVLDDHWPTDDAENPNEENHFVYRMDLALDVISEMQSKTREEQFLECTELWQRIEDVFSYAMEIAQVCDPYNFKAITGACQSIISEYENLKLQLNSESSDPALNSLFLNTLNDALYRLERKVNVSILNMVMEVFSEPFSALKRLVMTCGSSLSAKKRSKSDLTDVIEDFDQIIDKSMQIGLFAVASCKDKNRIGQIRNCLAGLESLETELISAITAFYLRPDSKEMRANVKLLTAEWQLEMNKLRGTIDLVMDSAAYCEVVLDDLQDRISTMSNCLDNREPVTQTQVQIVVQRSLSLFRQISATINDIGSDIVERQTMMMLRELKTAIIEADAASKSLLTGNATEPQQLRVIKRCELILNVVKRLQPALAAIMNNTYFTSMSYGKNGKGQGDTVHDAPVKFPSTIYESSRNEKTLTYIRTPYTVRNCKSPLSIQPANSAPRTQVNLSCLIPYIKKGREMRTERSIMYKTPLRANECSNRNWDETRPGTRKLSSVRQHLFSRDSIGYQDGNNLTEESMDLTNVLGKFSLSCASFESTSSNSRHVPTGNMFTTEDSSKKTSVSNLTESFVTAIEAQSSVITTDNTTECSIVGGGDGPL